MAQLDRLTRKPERSEPDRAGLDALLDEVLTGTLATVVDGEPWCVPMLFARDGDRILLHGSTGAGALRHAAAGVAAAFTVFSLDGIVVAHSGFDSSANYRSAVIRGRLSHLVGEEADAALDLLTDRLIPTRGTEIRGNLRKETAATIVLALPITPGGWLAKMRDGGPGEPEEPTDAWTGVVPLRLVAGSPVADPRAVDLPVPSSVRRLQQQFQAPS